MSLKNYFIFSLLIASTLLLNVQAAKSDKVSMTRDHVNNKLVFYTQMEGSFQLSLADVAILAVHPNSDISLLNATKKNKKLYLLLNIYFSSRPTKSVGRCAAGEEHYLLWIELDESRHLSKATEQIYSSCLFSLEIDKPINTYPPITIDALINTTPLTIIHTFNDNIREISYDVTEPENGLMVIAIP